MGTALDALNAPPSSLTARRQAASNLPNFSLPSPPTLHNFASHSNQKFPPLSTNMIAQPVHTSNVGNLLTPPSNSASESSSTSSGLPGNTPNTQSVPVLPYTPTYWQGPAHSGYNTGLTPQWSSNALFPPRSMFSPSLGSLGRNSPTAGESQSLPPPPYDLTAFQNLSSTNNASAIPTTSSQQHPMSHSLMHGSNATASQSSPATQGDSLQKMATASSLYNGQSSSNAQQSSYNYPGPSPVQQSPHSASASISRVSPPTAHNAMPQHQHNSFIRPPYPSYSLPAMQGPVMANIHSPNGPLSLVGSMQSGVLPFHSGIVAQPQNMYGNPRNSTPQQAGNDRPFKCDSCPQSFNRNHDLKRHKRIHLAVKPFPCGHCEKSFSRKDALKRHILVKGCGKGPSLDTSKEDSTVKSESGSDVASDSPIINGHA